MCLCAHIIFSSYDNIRILCPCCSMLSCSSLGFFLCGGCSSYYTIDREIIIFFGGASKVWILDNVIDYLERSHVKGDKNMKWKWSQNIMPRCNEHFFHSVFNNNFLLFHHKPFSSTILSISLTREKIYSYQFFFHFACTLIFFVLKLVLIRWRSC